MAIGRFLLGRFAWPLLLAAVISCSADAGTPETAGAAPASPAAPPAATQGSNEGPCAFLTTSEVQKVFPKSAPARLDRSREAAGVLSCHWDSPTGRLSLITGDGAATSAREEAEGWTPIFVDPLSRDAEKHVRYESLPNIGDEAVAVVEAENRAKGFIQYGAILVVRKGQNDVAVLSTELARRDRGEALNAWRQLGAAIASRMK